MTELTSRAFVEAGEITCVVPTREYGMSFCRHSYNFLAFVFSFTANPRRFQMDDSWLSWSEKDIKKLDEKLNCSVSVARRDRHWNFSLKQVSSSCATLPSHKVIECWKRMINVRSVRDLSRNGEHKTSHQNRQKHCFTRTRPNTQLDCGCRSG